VAPGSADEVAAVLRACSDAGVAVVPFGGGTSVVGGLEPVRGAFEALVSLDLGRMDGVVAVDGRSLTAVLEPGLRLPEADRALAGHGLTLGHVPQSYEWASVGGCVAARSAGQLSSGRGRIDANLVGVRVATPLGELATATVPASAAGPSLRQLAAGSEGALGVITEVALRVHRRPERTRHEGWFVPSFEAGCDALRSLAQAGAAPDVARLSDADETAMTLALSPPGGPARAYLRARLGDSAPGCLLVLGWEGGPGRRDTGPLRAAGGVYVGRRAGAAWLASRFAGPHVRDDLLDRGVMVETLETATSWSNLGRLHAAVRAALEGAHVGCHVSHLYPTGASLYFTALARQDADDPAAQWRAYKAAASEAILAAGGTITHHHGVGRDHAAYLPREDGALGVEVLRAVKERVDPAGIMNPGKLLALR
jgi:alkyldihydroxyacetonephosphate synthase